MDVSEKIATVLGKLGTTMIRFWSGNEPSQFIWRGHEIGQVIRNGWRIWIRTDAIQVGDLLLRWVEDTDSARELAPVTRIEHLDSTNAVAIERAKACRLAKIGPRKPMS